VTERMTERRVTGWKQVCKGLMTELVDALTNRVIVTDLDTRVNRLALQKQMEDAAIATEKKRKQEERKLTREAERNGTASVVAVEDRDEPSPHTYQQAAMHPRPASSSEVSLGFESTPSVPTGEEEEGVAAQAAIAKADSEAAAEMTDSEGVAKEEGEGAIAVKDSDPSDDTGPPSFLSEYRPGLKGMAKYDFSVSKLLDVQTALVSHEYDSEEGKVELLGHKSFWLERSAQLVRERRAEEQRVYDETKKAYDPLTNPFFFNVGHPLSRRDRIKMLKAIVKERRDNMTM
jgi:hypothetical protein